jgi:hypothetical protein
MDISFSAFFRQGVNINASPQSLFRDVILSLLKDVTLIGGQSGISSFLKR